MQMQEQHFMGGGNMGLIDKLKSANSKEELDEMLGEASDYRKASQETRNRWKTIYNRRMQELFSTENTESAPKEEMLSAEVPKQVKEFQHHNIKRHRKH